VAASSGLIVRDGAGRFLPGSARPRRRRGGAQLGNLNASGKPWLTFWRRRALRPEDAWARAIASEHAGSLLADKPDASAGELRAIEVAGVARGCQALLLDALRRAGGIDASKGLDLMAAVANFAKLELRALQTVGLARRAKRAPTLADILRGDAAALPLPTEEER
jgi:hypothetical protein